jgi:RNA polymerase sigma-70 factor (ECF subfamily)
MRGPANSVEQDVIGVNVGGNSMSDSGIPQIESFESVALPHMNDLYRAAYSMLRNKQEAEDVLQEMYLRAWRAFDRFTPGTNCKAWLFKILFNVVRNHRRKWFHRFTVTMETESLEGTMVYHEPVPEKLSDEEILAAFEKLPTQFAEVVMLADVYEFSYKEVHETLGIPIGTVMSRLSRGRQLLRAHLADSTVAATFREKAMATA